MSDSFASADPPPSLQQQIDAICDRFEAAIKADASTRIEDFLEDLPEDHSHELLKALIDLEIHHRPGATVSPTDYRQRFGSAFDAVEASMFVAEEPTVPPQTAAARLQSTAAGVGGSVQYFGEYELLQEIARGGMGVVYKARQSKLNRIVALKMILAGNLAGDEEVERFRNEAESAAALDHPGIGPVYEIGEHHGQHFFSMGFVDGPSLADRVKDGPLDQREAADIVRKVAEAVAYAHEHEKGVIHRDLKPANVLLDPHKEPRVTDFGLAKQMKLDRDLTNEGAVMGTPAYMPPEQAEGEKKKIGPRSDIYSIGAILYCLLTGRPPFQSPREIDILQQVTSLEPIAPSLLIPSVSKDLDTICLKCLEKSADKRYQAAAELAAELGRYLNGEPIQARPVSRAERLWRWCKRKPTQAGLIAVSILLLLTFSIGGPLVGLRQSRLLQKQLQAEQERLLAQADALRQATPAAAANILQQLDLGSKEITTALHSRLQDASLFDLQRNRIRLALLPDDADMYAPIVEFLQSTADSLPPDELLLIREVLLEHAADQSADLQSRFTSGLSDANRRLRSACVLAGSSPQADFWPEYGEKVSRDLVKVLPSQLQAYRQALRPIRQHLLPGLTDIHLNADLSDQWRSFATQTLADYQSDDSEELFELLITAAAFQFEAIFKALRQHRALAIKYGRTTLAETYPADSDDVKKDRVAGRKANAAVMLLRFSDASHVWPLLQQNADPGTRSYFIHWFPARGGNPRQLIERLQTETDSGVQQALLLCLGEFEHGSLPAKARTSFLSHVLSLYETHPDAGIHGASRWLLQQWGQKAQLNALNTQLQTQKQPDRNQLWYVNRQRQTFSVVNATDFSIGSPSNEIGRLSNEVSGRCALNRQLAVCTTEVTRRQWRTFIESAQIKDRHASADRPKDFSLTEDSPMVGINWFMMARYCNWLSEQENIPQEQWCYTVNPDGKYREGMEVCKDFWKRTGYRLPTDPEWEFFCRCGTTSSRFYGHSTTLLRKYGWEQMIIGQDRSTYPCAQLKPNAYGLFDILGNACEWCISAQNNTPCKTPESGPVDAEDQHILRGGSVLYHPGNGRSASRNWDTAGSRDQNYGLRVVRTLRLLPNPEDTNNEPNTAGAAPTDN